MTPKWSKNRLKLALGAPWGPPRANWILIFNPRVHFWPFLGPLWGPKINQKSTSGPKSGPRDQFLFNFCCTLRFYRFFNLFWLVFCSKNDKRNTHFVKAVWTFLKHATFTKHCILQVRSYVFSFCVVVFFCEKSLKKWVQNRMQKNHRKMSPRGSQDHKTPKICLKTMLFEGSIF